jgi:hypothetical protein
MEVTVAADAASVIAWWTDPERGLEFRAHLEGSAGVRDFEYREQIDHGLRIIEISYIAPIELRIYYRSSGRITEGVGAEINAQGNRVLRTEVYQHRVHPGGKEDISTAVWVQELISDGPRTTKVRVSTEVSRENAPWWERYIPPIAARQDQRRELRELAARCERDLGVNKKSH